MNLQTIPPKSSHARKKPPPLACPFLHLCHTLLQHSQYQLPVLLFVSGKWTVTCQFLSLWCNQLWQCKEGRLEVCLECRPGFATS